MWWFVAGIFPFTNFEPWPNSWRNRFLLQPKFGWCSDTIVFQQLFSHILWLYTHLKFKIIDTKKRWSWKMYLLSNLGYFGLCWIAGLLCFTRIFLFQSHFSPWISMEAKAEKNTNEKIQNARGFVWWLEGGPEGLWPIISFCKWGEASSHDLILSIWVFP